VTLEHVCDKIDLKVHTAPEKLSAEITGGYVSDLLSDVLANAQPGNLWVTIQVHQNVVAVALVKELSGVILANGREPDEETLSRAKEEGISIMTTQLTAFELVGRLYQLGISVTPRR
jgi:hypothetical protein